MNVKEVFDNSVSELTESEDRFDDTLKLVEKRSTECNMIPNLTTPKAQVDDNHEDASDHHDEESHEAPSRSTPQAEKKIVNESISNAVTDS